MPDTTHRRHPLRIALEARDARGLAAALASDVVLYSPISSSFRFEGRNQVAALLGLVSEVFEDLEYPVELGTEDARVIVFRARINGHELEGTDILQLDEHGLVREIRVFMRPLAAVAALAAALGPRMARRTGRVRSLVVSGTARPLAAIVGLVDRPGSRLAMGDAWAVPIEPERR